MAYPDRDYRSTPTESRSWGAYAVAIIVALVVFFAVMSAFRTVDTNSVTNTPAPPAATETPQTSPPSPATPSTTP